MKIFKSARELLLASVGMVAALGISAQVAEASIVKGTYHVECVGADGQVKWTDVAYNTVVTVGKNLILDQALAGSAYTVVGPYMMLISSASYSSISAADTMASHAGWLEAGATNAPTYTSPRKTCVWSSASAGSKALSAALAFAITGTGTIKGCAIVAGTGALTTIDNTAGTLVSAGLFTGGDRAVLSGDTVNVSYSMAL
jgi:hypothetical protein